ncbi:retrovirus-related pol polyprotein from transposon TNT 1-94 [Tanacetum coccineum]|uniref:Retrovirus-related pol polyprotein from transposon TNT 1-94 n=1 Tax=Tanacetum coccineum TaxID=301880 RepID=A0ABQ4ZX23_9ASTR
MVGLVMSLAAQNDWVLFQLDVKSAFLHGELNEEVFIDQPPGYIKKGAEQKVYRLKKALYGLKQAPRAWYSRIESYFTKEGFKRRPYEHTLFVKAGERGKILIVCIYVDDLIFTGNDKQMYVEFKTSMMNEFDMTDLGKVRYFLGIEVRQSEAGVFICQKRYAQGVLERFNMEKCNSVQNPIVPGCQLTRDEKGVSVDNTRYKQLIGSLMYLTGTRPDIMFVVSMLSRYMEHPTEMHFQAAKRVLRYIKGTMGLGILYKKGGKKDGNLVAYTDSDYARDLDDRKSTSGYVFLLNSGVVSWSSKKQPIVTLSTTEAEFVAAASCACQAVWLRRIMEYLDHDQNSSTTIFCDNSSTVELSRNPVLHGRSKHIDVRFHFLRELTRDNVVRLVHCPTQDQVADIMTKPLKLDLFTRFRSLMGVCADPNVN